MRNGEFDRKIGEILGTPARASVRQEVAESQVRSDRKFEEFTEAIRRDVERRGRG